MITVYVFLFCLIWVYRVSPWRHSCLWGYISLTIMEFQSLISKSLFWNLECWPFCLYSFLNLLVAFLNIDLVLCILSCPNRSNIIEFLLNSFYGWSCWQHHWGWIIEILIYMANLKEKYCMAKAFFGMHSLWVTGVHLTKKTLVSVHSIDGFKPLYVFL